MIRSASRPRAVRARRGRRRRRRRSSTTATTSRARVADRGGQHARRWTRRSGRAAAACPAPTSSEPVDITRTRWRGTTFNSPRPSAAASPSAAGVSTWPACSTVSPARDVLAGAPDVVAGVARLADRARCRCAPSVASTGTTASAPAGSGRAGHDPVRGAGVPATSASVRPAGMSSATGSFTGCRRRRRRCPRRRRRSRPWPSCRTPGSDSGATTSSASTRPSASPTVTVTGSRRRDQTRDDALMLFDGLIAHASTPGR